MDSEQEARLRKCLAGTAEYVRSFASLRMTAGDGGKLVVVNHEIEMPTMPASSSGAVTYFRGKTEADLESENLRALVFADDQNGHRIIMDAPVAPRSKQGHS